MADNTTPDITTDGLRALYGTVLTQGGGSTIQVVTVVVAPGLHVDRHGNVYVQHGPLGMWRPYTVENMPDWLRPRVAARLRPPPPPS